MSGKIEGNQNQQKNVMTKKICLSNLTLKEVFDLQKEYQMKVLMGTPEKEIFGLPQDSPRWFSYHIQAMVEEMGEVMKADKRWKTHRNKRFKPEEKLDEIADLFITVMNIAMYSNIDADTLGKAVLNKIKTNTGVLQD